ncbi:uncharacterized protein [Chironomus tepperi]|uniref:uncharacterized protein n=1 Tax=Chironomus tepperi TaxID=113505 RepID=UPI00391F66D6
MRFHIVVVILLCAVTERQTADCEYKNKYFWNHGIKTAINFYACDLKITPADINAQIKDINGQHVDGHDDSKVKFLELLADKKVKNLTSVICRKFSNLAAVRIAFTNLEHLDENSMENCENLENFDIDNCKIREFPENLLTKNSKLVRIWMHKNRLTTVPENSFRHQTELTHLELQENQIKFLPSNIFKSLKKLETLMLNDNKLLSIDPEWFKNLQNLRWIRLENNKITELPSKAFITMYSLEKLWLNGNAIDTLHADNFYGIYNLQNLNLKNNQISELPVGIFSQLKGLLGLNLAGNKLTTIHSDSFSNHWLLTKIWLQDNKINSIDEKFMKQSPVSYLNMTNNICCPLELQARNVAQLELRKCFDNYEPRISKPQNTSLSQKNAESCGKQVTGYGNIIGGMHTKRGDFPWNAALVLSDGRFFCGGILVSNRKVVTAAHCIQDKGISSPLLARDMLVLLGVYNLNNHYEPGRGIFSVQSINMHPDWNPHAESFDADITVLVLENEVIFGTNIQPICLPNSNITAVEIGFVVGYGKSEDDTKVHENIPKIIEVPIHKNEDCFLNNYLLAKLSSRRTFCGGTGTGIGVCNGDSGSGLIVTDGSAYYFRGVVSSSLLNANRECNVDTYSVFTDVTKYIDWINGVATSRFK